MGELWDVLDESGNQTGRLHERGKPMENGEYHLAVCVWIMNRRGEFLISKRTRNKLCPGMWECTGGNAVAGDDSLTTALKEVKEELGVDLKPENGSLLRRVRFQADEYRQGGEFVDIWFFRQEVDLSSIVLEPNETCDAMWATKEQISRMIEEKSFITWKIFSNIDALFQGMNI